MEYDYTYETIEKILVKRSLTDKKYLNIMSNIFDNRWFDKNKNHAILIELAVKFYKKYNTVPSNKVMHAMINKYSENHGTDVSELESCLMSIYSLNMVVDDECSNKNTQNYILEKAFYYILSDNVQEVLKTGNVDKCLERFDKIRKTSFQDDDLGAFYFRKDDMLKHWDYIKNPAAKISTGWAGLDFHTNGGFLKDGRMLALFVGQAGLGKSLFLSNIAVNLLEQDKSVLVISLEMSQDVYMQRFDAVIADNNINRLKNNAQDCIERIDKFYKDHPHANLIVKEYAPKTIKVVDIEAYIEKLIQNEVKIDAIVIDYLNLVLPNTSCDNMYQSVMAVAEQLRSLSYKFKVPVISATQANRQGINNENIGLENISESNGQAATADFIGMLYQTDDDREHNILNMKIAKNRFGAPGGIIHFTKNPETLKLEDKTYQNTETDLESDRILNETSELSSDIDDI